MEITLIILSILTLLSTLIPLLTHEHWMVRFFDFPYVQFTCLNLVLLALVVFIPFDGEIVKAALLISLSASLVYRTRIVFPYTPLARVKIPGIERSKVTTSIKIISANVLMYNDDYKGLIRIVENEKPDLLLLVETDATWKDAVNSSLEKVFSYQIHVPSDNTYGLLFYSKFELESQKLIYRIEEDVPSIDTIIRLENGKRVRFFGLHPKPPSPSENETSLPRDAELVQVGKEAKGSELPVIIAGDLNDVAWSHTTRLFIRISELLDPRMGRGFFNTYHAHYPLLRWPLDHLFLSPDFQIIEMKRLDNFHSDHFPICAEIALQYSEKAEKNIKSASAADREEASVKIEEANNMT